MSEPVTRITCLEDTAEHPMEHASRPAAAATVTRVVFIGCTRHVLMKRLNAPDVRTVMCARHGRRDHRKIIVECPD